MNQRRNDAIATLSVGDEVYNLKAGTNIVGRKSADFEHDIVIDDASVDVKHAAIEITAGKYTLVDIFSKCGTFLANEQLKPLQIKELPRAGIVRFGNVKCKFCADEVFDYINADSPDIIPGSPEHSTDKTVSQNAASRIRNGSRKSVTSTPQSQNSRVVNKNKIKEQNKDSNIADKSLDEKENENASKCDSFCIPSTQFNLNKSKSFRNNLCAFEEDEDDFFIPETQECNIGRDSEKSDETIQLGSSEYNAGYEQFEYLQSQNLLNASLLNDNESQIIPFIEPNAQTPKAAMLDKQKQKQPETVEDTDYDAELSTLKWEETIAGKDKSSKSKESSTLRSNSTTPDLRSTSVTPDLVFDEEEVEADQDANNKNNEKNIDADKENEEELPQTQVFSVHSVSVPKSTKLKLPDVKGEKEGFNISPTNKENILSIPNVNAQINSDGGFLVPFPVRKNLSLRETSQTKKESNENVTGKTVSSLLQMDDDDDDLLATQVFHESMYGIKKNSKPSSTSSLVRPASPSENDDDLMPTQIFRESMYLKPNKSATVDSTEHKDKENDIFACPTQEIIGAPVRRRTPMIINSDDESESDSEFHNAATLPIVEAGDQSSKVNYNRLTLSSDEDGTFTKTTSEKTESRNNLLSKDRSSASASTDHELRTFVEQKQRRKSVLLMDVQETPDFLNLKLPNKDILKEAGELFSKEINTRITFPYEQSSDEEESNTSDAVKSNMSSSKKSDTKGRHQDHKNENESTSKHNKTNEDDLKVSSLSSSHTTDSRVETSSVETTSTEQRKSNRTRAVSKHLTGVTNEKTEVNINSRSLRRRAGQKADEKLKKVEDTKFSPVKEQKSSKRRLLNIQDEKILLKKLGITEKGGKAKQEVPESNHRTKRQIRNDPVPEPEVQETKRRGRKRKSPSREPTDKKGSVKGRQKSECESETSPIRKSARTRKPRIVFTKIDSSTYEKDLKRMGAELTRNIKDCTVLVTDQVYRTSKFLSAVARGIPIVSPDWLKSSSSSPDKYLLVDRVSESRFKFSLRDSLDRARRSPIFKNFIFYITRSTRPTPEELKQIINNGKGIVVDKLSAYYRNEDHFYIVSDKSDMPLWGQLKLVVPNAKIIKTEGIMSAVLQQKVEFERYYII